MEAFNKSLENGYYKRAKHIILNNQKLDRNNIFWRTCLIRIIHIPNERQALKFVRLLLKQKVDINNVDVDGDTVLILAVKKNYASIVYLLLNQIDINVSLNGNIYSKPIWT